MTSAVKTWSTPIAQEEQQKIPCPLCGGQRFVPKLRCEGFGFVQCSQCGLVLANPQPTEGAIRRRYRENHGEAYLAYEQANEEAFLSLQLSALRDVDFSSIERSLRSLSPEPPKVLDVGCALGTLLVHLRGRGWDCTGVELSTPQATYARGRGLKIYDRALDQALLPDDYFGLVTASHLIEHLNDPDAFVREVRRVLTPGGYFIVTTPNIDGFQARLFRGKWRSAIFDHLFLYSRTTLRNLLSRRGFVVERTVTWGGLGRGTAPPTLKALVDRLAKPLGFGDVMAMRARKPQEPV